MMGAAHTSGAPNEGLPGLFNPEEGGPGPCGGRLGSVLQARSPNADGLRA